MGSRPGYSREPSSMALARVLCIVAVCVGWYGEFAHGARQEEARCGLVALKAFCLLQGRNRPLDELDQLLKSDVWGLTTVHQMEAAMRSLGFDPVSVVVDVDQLRQLPTPVILLAYPGGSPHYMVMARHRQSGKRMVLDLPEQELPVDRGVLEDLGWRGVCVFDGSGLLVKQEFALMAEADERSLLTVTEVFPNPGDSVVELPVMNRTGRTVKILGVRASCQQCLDSGRPFSYPRQLKTGEEAKITVRLTARPELTLPMLGVFVQTDRPLNPVELCTVIFQHPPILRPAFNPIGRCDAQAKQVDVQVTSSKPLDVGSIHAFVSHLGGEHSIPVPCQLTPSRQEEYPFLVGCRVTFDAHLVAEIERVAEPYQAYQVQGSSDSRIVKLTFCDNSGEIGTALVQYSRKPKAELSSGQLFFGEVMSGVRSAEKSVTVTLLDRQFGSMKPRAGFLEESVGLSARCVQLGEMRWKVTVQIGPRATADPGFHLDTLVLAFGSAQEGLNFSVPVHWLVR